MTIHTQKIIQGLPPRIHAGPPAPSPPKFGIIGPEAISMLVTDTTSVLIPKLLIARTDINAFEDIFLECAENVPFYVVIPLVARQLFAKAFGKLNLSPNETKALSNSLKEGNPRQKEQSIIGTSLKNLLARAEKAHITIPSRVIAAKAGTILGALSLAGAVEYMVQHSKNVATAKAYRVKDFTTVAGLQNYQTPENNADPVEKAKKRALQTGATTLGLIGGAFALPVLIRRSGKVRQIAESILKQFDFGHHGLFDMSKPLLLLLALTGFASYLDASRDKLEFKENLTRVPIIIGFYMAGKEALSNLLAGFLQQMKVPFRGKQTAIKNIVPFLDRKLLFKDSFLDLNMVKSSEELSQGLSRIQHLSADVRDAIVRRHQGITLGSRLFTILIMGILFNKLLYQATQARHDKSKPAGPAPAGNPLKPGPVFNYMNRAKAGDYSFNSFVH